jgi:leader peptidase (prepilin peptidase)/N-methyltransferase
VTSTSLTALGAAAAIGIAAGLSLRAAVFHHSVAAGSPWRTACPTCDAILVHRGWRLAASALRPSGRCPRCTTAIGPAPGIVEVLAAVTLAVLAWRSGVHVATLALAWAALLAVALGLVDVAVHRLPDRLIVTALAGTLAMLGIATVTASAYSRLLIAVACGLAAGVVYFVIVFAAPGGMGLGDAKLAVLVGLTAGWFGVRAAVFAIVAGVVYAGLGAIALLVMRRATRGDRLAYGPFMLLGALTAIVLAR